MSGATKVVFAGVDEVAEIAYLSLQEFDMELAGAFDDTKKGLKILQDSCHALS